MNPEETIPGILFCIACAACGRDCNDSGKSKGKSCAEIMLTVFFQNGSFLRFLSAPE